MPTVVIPAHLESSRFPRKMLLDVDGTPLIRRVYDRCLGAGYPVLVATDSKEIASVLPQGAAMMTLKAGSGTERIIQIMHELENEEIINIQGDMIDVTPFYVHMVANVLEKYHVATLCCPTPENWTPNSVNVIHSAGRAHWFTRKWMGYTDHHIGVYGYTREALEAYRLTPKTPAEDLEMLEQLRWYATEYQVGIVKIQDEVTEINTPDDFAKWRKQNALTV